MSNLNNKGLRDEEDIFYEELVNFRKWIVEEELSHSSLELSQLLNDHGKSEKEMNLLREICNTHTGNDTYFDLIQSLLRVELDYYGKKSRTGIYKKMERNIDRFIKGEDL